MEVAAVEGWTGVLALVSRTRVAALIVRTELAALVIRTRHVSRRAGVPTVGAGVTMASQKCCLIGAIHSHH
jgi:hypothetical protein